MEEIHAAYRRLARSLHPDASGDADEMSAVNEAWRVLSHADRRAAYDATLVAPTPTTSARPAAPEAPTYAFVSVEEMDDIDDDDRPVGPAQARVTRQFAMMLGVTLVATGVLLIGMFVYAFSRSGTLFP